MLDSLREHEAGMEAAGFLLLISDEQRDVGTSSNAHAYSKGDLFRRGVFKWLSSGQFLSLALCPRPRFSSLSYSLPFSYFSHID